MSSDPHFQAELEGLVGGPYQPVCVAGSRCVEVKSKGVRPMLGVEGTQHRTIVYDAIAERGILF